MPTSSNVHGPFIVLHVCMGNICRSPMAERLLAYAVAERDAAHTVLSESAGTGPWHAGQPMNAPAATEMRRRGVDHADFRARHLVAAHIDTADLVLTATTEQYDFALGLRPDARERVFVLGEFARLVEKLDPSSLPPAQPSPSARPSADDVRVRGRALVHAVAVARGDARPRAADDLDDPYGRSQSFFAGTADRIVASLDPLVDALLPKV
jgi:protein-tyrosine phosphatase